MYVILSLFVFMLRTRNLPQHTASH